MSQKSKKIIITNNLSTSKGRSVSRRSTRVFGGARDPSVQETVFLYKLVFNTRKAVLLSVFLLLCFVSQPFHKVYADTTKTTDVVPASSHVDIPPEFTQEIVESEIIDETPSESQEAEESETDEVYSVEESPPVIEVDESIQKQNDISTTSDELVVDVATSTNSLPVVTSSTTTSADNASTDDVKSTSDDVLVSTTSTSSVASTTQHSTVDTSDEIDDKVASTLSDEQSIETISNADLDDEVTTNNDGLVSVVESDSQFSFMKSECTRIEDGSFYCQKQDSSVNVDDSLLAAPDQDGDLEIFLVRAGERTQITHNKVDDASPYYDEYSRTIVWHRLVNDRYQIISYDTETGKENQLTDTSVNNMEPTRHGDYTVWQRWVENNWEIVLLESGKEKQITNSSRHDIAPHVRGPLVIWNSRSNDGTQSLMTYDIQNRTYTTIADGEGVSVSNPRLMVMYEAMYENGDIVMKGFDVVTGKIVPLQSLPGELPTDLPNTDSTGETRALIQNKPAPKQADVVDSRDNTSSGSSTPPLLPEVDSDGTLDLRATTTVDIGIVQDIFDSATSSIPDLIIPAATSSADSASSSQTVTE